MRWWLFTVLFIYPLLTTFAFAPIPQQEDIASPDWLTLLHLKTCEFPCWIGITPGETTVSEAEELIAAAFADSTYEIRASSNFARSILDKPTGAELRIYFLSDNGASKKNSIVQIIGLQAFMRNGTVVSFPSIADLQSLLGEPTTVRLGTGVEIETIALLYSEGLAHVVINDRVCDEIVISQEVINIRLYHEIPADFVWLSEPQAWRGFDYCYNFKRRLN